MQMPRTLTGLLAALSVLAAVSAWAADEAAVMHHGDHHAMPAAQTVAAPAGQARTPVRFPGPLREHTLANMRDHLAALGEIQDALARSDFDAAGRLAEQRLGMSSLTAHGAHDVAPFMPAGMQTMGTDMHHAASQFAVAAQDAAVTGDLGRALAALARVNRTCVACHAAYRLE